MKKEALKSSLSIKCFGIAKDIVGGELLDMRTALPINVEDLKMEIVQKFPAFSELKGFAIAINAEYALEDQVINPSDDIAIIPPVSGG